MQKSRSIRKPGVNIDMTPLVDVILLLLTFFMLTATFKAESSEAIEVDLPLAASTDTTKMPEQDIMVLTLTPAGDVFLDVDNYLVRQKVFDDAFGIGLYHPDSTTLSEFEQTGKINEKEFRRKVIKMNREQFKKTLTDLRVELRNITGGEKDFRIVIKGDKETNYGVVEDLMDILKETRNTRFALVTDIKPQ
jgi:biopolymer transport protein ExbD